MMLRVAGIILCEILLYTLLKQIRPEFAVISEAAAACVLIFMLGDEIRDALAAFEGMLDATGFSASHISVLIKVLGISVVTQFSADMCRDAGESALASKVEFAGRIIITAAAIPIIKAFTETVARLVGDV